jgi:DNA-binding NtrC family response regulator
MRSDFRTIGATNESVHELVMSGRLRGDLAHRLAGVVIRVPALAVRVEDIPLLAGHFLLRAGASSQLDNAALEVLCGHSWPGNVRELRNVVECAAALGGLSAATIRALITQNGGSEPAALLARRNHLRATLEANHWNADSAARALGVHRATIYRWIKEGLVARPA